MNNIPEVRIGLVAVSRDCFPRSLSQSRCQAVATAYQGSSALVRCETIVENELDMVKALAELKAAGCNALVVYLGNFGPEIPETLLAKAFDGPVMFAAAAEDRADNLLDGRGDAYCGLLNASYNLDLRSVRAYIPENPVGTPMEVAEMIAGFIPVARAIIGVRKLKIISFGPRPQDFLACNAPIRRLYDLGIEIEENSELDLFSAFKKHAGDIRIPDVAKSMADELGRGNTRPEFLSKLAQFELTLLDWMDAHKGSRDYVVFADKCWPAFEAEFGFVPCYVNSRLAARGIPVACEVDIYGALSEYIGCCVSDDIVTLLDVNNTVPADMYKEAIEGQFQYRHSDTFMGFHCGNTASAKMASCSMKNQKIMARTMPEDITVGTLEGDIAPGRITLYRIQSTADARLTAYVAQGEVLPVATRSFGSIGVFAVPDMGRFYRHVLIEGHFPHHGAIAFGHFGREIFSVFKLLGVTDIGWNQPAGLPYRSENPFG